MLSFFEEIKVGKRNQFDLKMWKFDDLEAFQ